MNYQDIIDKVRENASEWLEMSENPDEIIIGILAKKLANLKVENEILEERLRSRYVSR